ncbi:MAG: CPBP family intramembrane glutamic endopeptidase [Jatrophihabitantaceae bacterium]
MVRPAAVTTPARGNRACPPAAHQWTIVLGILGLGAAVVVRMQIAGPAGARSAVAGTWFAVALIALALLTRGSLPPRPVVSRWRSRPIALGLTGALVLCAPPALRHLVLGRDALPGGGFLTWAAVVVLVAVAEETLLRGSLYRAIERSHGTAVAIAVTSVAFALLHAPLYGWAVVPLDITVGVWLGALRAVSGSVTAPALAHALADLAGWWIR